MYLLDEGVQQQRALVRVAGSLFMSSRACPCASVQSTCRIMQLVLFDSLHALAGTLHRTDAT